MYRNENDIRNVRGIARPAIIPSRRPIARKSMSMIMNIVVMPFLVRVLRSFLMNWALSLEMTTSVFNGIIWSSLSSSSFESRSLTIVIVFPPLFLITVKETAFFEDDPSVEIRENVFLLVVSSWIFAMSFRRRFGLIIISPSSCGFWIWLSNRSEYVDLSISIAPLVD